MAEAWPLCGGFGPLLLTRRRERGFSGQREQTGEDAMAYAPFDLTGKVALVTGGNGGIGFGMVEAMAQAGADVVIWGSNPDKNAAAEAKLKPIGVRVLAQRVDV